MIIIQRLERVISSCDGELQTSRLPNNEEVMAKMNEIVEWINKREKIVDDICSHWHKY